MSLFTYSSASPWPKRIHRARNLAGQGLSSRQLLEFYVRVLEFQKDVHDGIAPLARPVHAGPDLRQGIDVTAAAGRFPALLTLVQQEGPSELAAKAERLGRETPGRFEEILTGFLCAKSWPPDESSFFSRALLQPYVEHLAYSNPANVATVMGNRCPCCESIPQVAVIRPEGDGGKRFLLCSLCQWEWEFRRIWCPACREENHEKLPRYSADRIPAVRVEACDTTSARRTT